MHLYSYVGRVSASRCVQMWVGSGCVRVYVFVGLGGRTLVGGLAVHARYVATWVCM